MATKHFELGDLFTEAEIEAARTLYLQLPTEQFNRRVVEEVVQAAMPRIDRVTGQQNDARYMGYALANAFMSTGLVAGSEPATAPRR